MAFAAGFAPPAAAEGPARTVAEAEALLADWFDAEVVLTGAGRSALRLAFAELGLNRYRDRIAMSPKTAGCVLDAVIRHGFPVDPASDGAPVSAALVIDQYGFRQEWQPDAPMIEDVCHAFHGAPDTGARRWRGAMAAFSLNKFLPLAGMAGGLVVRSAAMAARLRERRGPPRDPAVAVAERSAWRSGDAEAVARVQYERLNLVAPDPGSLAGLPSVQEMAKLGRQRAAIVDQLLAASPDGRPTDWDAMLRAAPPFVAPVFGDTDRLGAVAAAVRADGIEAGLYSIDIARSAAAPEWRTALLVPCHPWLGADRVASIVRHLVA